MLLCKVHVGAALAIISGLVLTAARARADEVVVVTSSERRAETPRRHDDDLGPDGRQIGAGVVAFGVAYAIGVGVASSSEHRGDNHLYVPLAGPWMDFADRGHCPPSLSCSGETGNRVLLVADGIVQALGVLSVVSGLLFERHYEHDHSRSQAERRAVATVQVTPVEYPHGGLGLAAVGTF